MCGSGGIAVSVIEERPGSEEVRRDQGTGGATMSERGRRGGKERGCAKDGNTSDSSDKGGDTPANIGSGNDGESSTISSPSSLPRSTRQVTSSLTTIASHNLAALARNGAIVVYNEHTTTSLSTR